MAAVFTGELSLCGHGLQDLQPTCTKPLPAGGLQHIQGQSSGSPPSGCIWMIHNRPTNWGRCPFFRSAGGKRVLWISGSQILEELCRALLPLRIRFPFSFIGLFGHRPVFLRLSKIIFDKRYRTSTRRVTLEHMFHLKGWGHQLELWWAALLAKQY